jgi:hypothetical protein
MAPISNISKEQNTYYSDYYSIHNETHGPESGWGQHNCRILLHHECMCVCVCVVSF